MLLLRIFIKATLKGNVVCRMHPALKDMPRLCSFKPTARQLSAKTYVYYKRKSIFPSSSFLHFSKNSSCAPIPNWEFSIQIFISSPNKRKGRSSQTRPSIFFLLLYSSSVIYAIWQYRKKQRAYLVAMVLKKSSLSALVFSSEIKKGEQRRQTLGCFSNPC